MYSVDPSQFKEGSTQRTEAEVLTLNKALVLEEVDDCFSNCKKPVKTFERMLRHDFEQI